MKKELPPISVLYKPARERRKGTGGRFHYKNRVGGGKWVHRVGCSDRDTTAAQATAHLRESVELGADGYGPDALQPLGSLIDRYELRLKKRRRDAGHVAYTVRQLRLVSGALGWTRATHVQPGKLESFLHKRASERDTGARTFNAAVKAWSSFANWLHREGVVRRSPMQDMDHLNEATDRRHVRRVLKSEDDSRLIRAAIEGPPLTFRRCGAKFVLSGGDRAVLYACMLATGLRLGEAAAVTPADFEKETDGVVVVRLDASVAKSRRSEMVYLAGAMLPMISGWVRGKPKDEPLWSLPHKPVDYLLKPDLERAGIEYQTDDGFLDFHALRHTFITRAACKVSGVAELMVLSRITDVEVLEGYINPDKRETGRRLALAIAGRSAGG